MKPNASRQSVDGNGKEKGLRKNEEVNQQNE